LDVEDFVDFTVVVVLAAVVVDSVSEVFVSVGESTQKCERGAHHGGNIILIKIITRCIGK
jgi:hypothetical protein